MCRYFNVYIVNDFTNFNKQIDDNVTNENYFLTLKRPQCSVQSQDRHKVQVKIQKHFIIHM